MPTYEEHLEAITRTIADYRSGQIAPRTAALVDRWMQHFPAAARHPLAAELNHVLARSYFSKERVRRFLRDLAISAPADAADPKAFWSGVRFLRLQQQGGSQRDLLALMADELGYTLDLHLDDCGKTDPHTFLYLDDCIYSGGRIRSDILRWLETEAPERGKLVVITLAAHWYGRWNLGNQIDDAVRRLGKQIELNIASEVELENRLSYKDRSDILWLSAIPDDVVSQAYIASWAKPPILRAAGSAGKAGLFSGEAGRALLERELFRTGLNVRGCCRNLPGQMRPLGCSMFEGSGFGSMVVTYRNCANNTSLALWVNEPWFPLFPRIPN